MTLGFMLVDVFSAVPFGGNQLAVITDGDGLDDVTMQVIAREFGFSETTFVMPADSAATDHRLRIFTPRMELPFAGHPIVGTAAALAGQSSSSHGPQQVTFATGTGPVSVDVDGAYGRLALTAWLDAPDHDPDPEAVAATLSLSTRDIVASWYASVGMPFCYVQLDSVEAVDRAVLDTAAWSATGLADSWSPHLYAFAGELRSGSRLYARAFAPAAGVDEDPATGSACAALAARLAHLSTTSDRPHSLTIRQGVSMGRPSTIDATASRTPHNQLDITVGGFTTIVGEGTMAIPWSGPEAADGTVRETV